MHKFFDKMKDFFTFGPVSIVLTIWKRPLPQDTEIVGSLVMTAKQDTTITHVTFTLEETFEQVKGTKVDTTSYTLGTYEHTTPLQLKQLEVTTLAFAVPFSLEKWSRWDTAVYTGDFGLMNKFSDMAKQKNSIFTLKSTVTLDTWKTATTSKKITFPQQEQEDIG